MPSATPALPSGITVRRATSKHPFQFRPFPAYASTRAAVDLAAPLLSPAPSCRWFAQTTRSSPARAEPPWESLLISSRKTASEGLGQVVVHVREVSTITPRSGAATQPLPLLTGNSASSSGDPRRNIQAGVAARQSASGSGARLGGAAARGAGERASYGGSGAGAADFASSRRRGGTGRAARGAHWWRGAAGRAAHLKDLDLILISQGWGAGLLKWRRVK